jgi:hypothetical protein
MGADAGRVALRVIVALGASAAILAAPATAAEPSLEGSFRTEVRVTSGGKPFGQHRGDRSKRTYRFRGLCGKAVPCDRVRLRRKGREGAFGSTLKRRGDATWRGVEKVHGRCSDGLDFHSTTTIVLRATGVEADRVTSFEGKLKAKVSGCVKGREHAAVRGRLR